MNASLNPFVYWAQDDKSISLRIDLRNSEAPSIEVGEESVKFSSIGDGAGGRHEYCFFLKFHDKVDIDKIDQLISDSNIRLTVKKQKPDWWPRLYDLAYAKPPWLRIDFDKWKDPSADEDSDRVDAHRGNFDMDAFEKLEAERLVQELSKDFDVYGHKDFRYSYLIVYNIGMFLGFLFIFLELIRGFVDIGEEYLSRAYVRTSSKIICCQIAQFLEVAHVLVGYVKSGWLPPLLQTCGRGIVLFALIVAEPRMQDKPVVFYLFVIWSLIEIIRYPYYVFTILNTERFKTVQNVVAWLRYTMWIPLYPLGVLCEGVIIIRAIPYFVETRRFTFRLPNCFNVSFDFTIFLQAYLALALLPGLVYMMNHLRIQRTKKIGKEAGTVKKFKKSQ